MVLHHGRQSLESSRIDHIAARVPKEARREFKFAERSSVRIANPLFFEISNETRSSFHLPFQWGLVDEKHVFKQCFAGGNDAWRIGSTLGVKGPLLALGDA